MIFGQKEGIEEGKFAPGLTGNFEISISPEDTNVSVRYDITLHSEGLQDSQFIIKSIEEVETQNPLIKTAQNTYTGIIPLEEITDGYKNRLKIEIEWSDDGTHDEEDTRNRDNLSKNASNSNYTTYMPIFR